MANISIIFTRHMPYGNCNSNQLYGIIESIKPEVIFEELSVENFDRAYKHKSLTTLETAAIKTYLNYFPVKQVPVDTLELPKFYEDDYDRMFSKITNDRSLSETLELYNLIDYQLKDIFRYGFPLLNSKYIDEYTQKIDNSCQVILSHYNDENLWHIYTLDKEVKNKREDQMLDNIYKYAEANEFKQALFFIGCGHREPILKKIRNYSGLERVKLNWIDHDYTDSFGI